MRNLLRYPLSWILLIFAIQVSSYSLHPTTPYNTTSLSNIVIHTASQRISPNAPFNLTFLLADYAQPLKLALQPNHDLLHQDPEIQYIDRNGLSRRTEILQRHRYCVFKGSVLSGNEITGWTKVGWTRISVLRDGTEPLFDGAFSVGNVQYHVKAEGGVMVAFYASDEDEVLSTIGDRSSDSGMNGTDIDTTPHFASQLRKRQFGFNPPNLVNTIGSIDGCPTDRRIALVGIATDCTFTGTFSSQEELVDSILSMVNTASEVFENTFNIALAVGNLTIEEEDCPTSPSSDLPWNVGCSGGLDLNWRLQQFTSWRATNGGSDNAYWTLLSGCPTGTEVGVSWVGELCNEELSANVVALAQNQWQVFAHESAHTFGAYHDCDSSTCSISSQRSQCCPLSTSTCSADAQYLMNPVSTSPQREFSPCTVGNVCSAFDTGRVSTQCLTTNANTPPTISAGECGNGIVEVGEECDCGGEEGCAGNECCDGATCRLRGNAECDDADGGCCSGCMFRGRGEVCRAAIGECDIEETCSGDEAACPSDRFEDDGASCGSGSDLFCSSGQCTNRDMQCQAMVTGDNSTISSCGNSTCVLECTSTWVDGSCARGGNVLDGTPCDGGMCRGGQCRSRSRRDDDVESWVQRNLSLVIGLSAGIGGLLLLLIVSCIAYCCCCRRRPKAIPNQAPLPPIVGYAPPPYSRRPAVPSTPYYRYA